MNSVIQSYRQSAPGDTRSDEELLRVFADGASPEFFQKFPDFAKDWQAYQTQQNVDSSSILGEVGKGIKRGFYGLEAAAVGAGALGADYLGLPNVRNTLLEAYKGREEKLQEVAPSVPNVQTAFRTGPRAVAQWVAGEGGALIPNVGEAVVAGTIGAMAGSAVAPGVGTAAGAAEGFFARSAAKAAVKRLLTKNPLLTKELEEYAAGKTVGSALSKEAAAVIDAGVKAGYKTAGSYIATGANFAAQGAGGTYGALSQIPGVSDQDALEAAAIAGAGSSVGALVPAGILKQLFPGVGEQAAKSYVDIWAKKIPKEILTAGGGMGAMEFFNILAEKHADPKKKNTDFTGEDYSRLLNSFTIGVLASIPAVAVTAVRGREAKEPTAEPPPPGKTPEAPPSTPAVENVLQRTLVKSNTKEPEPALSSKEINRTFPTDLTPEQRLAMDQVIQRDVAGELTEADKTYIGTLPEVVKAQYETLKQEAQNATQVRQEQDRLRLQRERDDAQLRQEEADRNKPPQDKKEGAETSTGDSLLENARRLEQALGLEAGELDRKKGESYEDYVERFTRTVAEAQKAKEPGTSPKQIPGFTTSIKQAPWPAKFNTVKELLDFRQTRLAEERALYQEQIGITEDQARRLQSLLQRDADTGKFEKSLTSDQRQRLEDFFERSPLNKRGGPFEGWDTHPTLNPEDAAAATPAEAVENLTRALSGDVEQAPNNDRFLYAAISAKKLQESGVNQRFISHELRKIKARAGADEEYFVLMAKRLGDFFRSQGIEIPPEKPDVRARAIEKAAETPQTAERIVAATVTNPKTGVTTAAESHPAAAENQGLVAPESREAREKPEAGSGFLTSKGRIVGRAEGEKVAQAANQIMASPEAKPGAPIHSDQIDPLAWLQKVSNRITAWVTVWKDARTAGYSDLGTETGKKDSTKRLGVFTTPDGKGKVVGTIYRNRGVEYVWLGEPQGRRWESVIAEGYKPHGFIHLDEPQRRFLRTYTNKEWAPIEDHLDSKMAKTESKVAESPTISPEAQAAAAAQIAEGALTRTQGRPEQKETGISIGAVGKSDAERIATVVDDYFTYKDWGVPTEDSARDNVDEALLTDKALTKRLVALGGQDKSLILYGKIFDAYTRVAKEFEESGNKNQAQFKARMIKELEGLNAKGKDVPPETGPGTETLHSVPSRPSKKRGTSELVGIAQHVVDRLIKAGIPVNVMQRTTGEIVGSFADSMGRATGQAVGGMYDRAQRAVTWVVSDLTAPNRQDLRVLFEEAGHALLDRESAEVRDPMLRAITKLADKNFGLTDEQLRDIQAAYPEGARPEVMAEEALMAILSKRLVDEGFNPDQSQGLAQALMRLVKELYLKGAMWVQQNLLGRGYDNSDLAQRYFENRLRGFLAGDHETLSWINRLGGGKAPYDQQVRWQTPIGTSEMLVQKYNPLTGRIETASFPQDSVQAALLDIQDDLRYSVQAPDLTVPIPTVPLEVRLNRAVATANDTLDLHEGISKITGIPAAIFRQMNRIKDPNNVKAALNTEASRKQIQGYNPEQRTDQFRHEQNYGPGWVQTFQTFFREKTKVSKRIVEWQDRKAAMEAGHEKILREGGAALKNYLDADLTAEQIAKDFKALTLQELRSLRLGARRLGGIMREMQQLDGDLNKPVDPKMVNALRRLFTGTELDGTKLFTLLDSLANDQSIDFSRPAAEIRESIRSRADIGYVPYERITQDTPESRALLATVIYYGKTRDRIMAQLQMRRMASGEDRAALEAQLKDLWKETSAQITQGIRRVASSAKVQDRAKAAYRRLLGEAVTAKKNMQRLDDAIKMNQAAIPEYNKALDIIAGKRGFAQETAFGNGMVLSIPKSNASKPGFDEFKIQLSSHAGEEVTDPAKLQEIVDKQSAWMLARENEAKAGDQAALGLDYQRVRRQRDELAANVDFQARLRNTGHYNTELVMSSAAKQAEAMGTAAGGIVGRMVRQFSALNVAIRTEAERLFGYKNPRLRHDVVAVLNRGRKGTVDPVWFERQIAGLAIRFMEKLVSSEDPRISIEQSLNDGYAALGSWLLRHEHIRPLIQDRMGEFMPALRKMIEGREAAGQHFVAKDTEHNLQVLDPRTGLLRDPHKVGLVTVPQRFTDTFFTMVNALVGSGWATTGVDERGTYGPFRDAAKFYREDRPKLDQTINRLFRHPVFGDNVIRDFLYPLSHNPDETPFRMSFADEADARTPAAPADVARAYDESITPQGLDIIGMFEKLHQATGGVGDVGDYVEDSLMQLSEHFHQALGAKNKMEPGGDAKVSSLKSVVPNAFIDARMFPYWPAEWFEYHQFDRNDIARISERVAGQIAFGRNSERLANAHETLKGDVDGMVADLRTVLATAEGMTPSGKKKDIDRKAAAILAKSTNPELQKFKTGEERLRFLRKTEKRSKFVDKFRDDLSLYFKRHNDPSNSLQWGIRVAQEVASLLVNQPASAISQLATVFDIPVQWGASPIMLGRTARVVGLTAKDIAGSLAQAVGIKFLPLSYYEEKFRSLYQDPESARRAGDIYLTLEGEQQNKAARALRIARDIQSMPVNLLGTEARYTPLRPFAPFFQTVNSTNRALTVSLWEMADRFVAKGLDYLRSNPGAEKITGKELGLSKWDQDGFARWSADIGRYGLKFEDMVKEAKQRVDSGNRTLLTDKQLSLLYGLGLNEISLESNIGTMPLSAFNNRILRFVIPLQGWSFRRTMQLLDKRLDTKDQTNLRAVRNAMLGLAATMGGGLALSLLVDAYQEDVLGKRRNIRDLQVPTTGADWIAMNERLARVGTFGMFGDISNNLLGMGTGQGDNRAISIDQRVVAMQAFQGLIRAVNAFINQNFDADYKNVVRPAISSVGGNGMLQYMQMVNQAFGLDNLESRTIKRINAQNYLRVAGRDLGMSIRAGSGGAYATPTPINPWLGRMEYAVYGNDPEAFREAYRGAVAQAKESGHSDAEDYVRKAFETRHPLRYVFSVTPSLSDYRKVLGAMDDRGREDVTEAVRLFNHYGQSIGLKPFEGSAKKDQQRAFDPEKIMRARMRALQVAGGYGL